MKVIAANGAEKYERIKGKRKADVKQQACLVYHQHCTGGDEQAGKDKKIKYFF
jgi:hypothetical protein